MNLKNILIVFGYVQTVTSFGQKHLASVADLYKYAEALYGAVKYLSIATNEQVDFKDARLPVAVVEINTHRSLKSSKGMPGSSLHKIEKVHENATDLIQKYYFILGQGIDLITSTQTYCLFAKDHIWKTHLTTFHDLRPLRLKVIKEFKEKIIPYEDYILTHDVLSDEDRQIFVSCFAELAENRDTFGTFVKCKADLRCIETVAHTDIMYGSKLTYWLTYLIHMMYTKKCYLLSPSRDYVFIVHKLCNLAYNEALYIEENGNGLIVQYMLKASFCAMMGFPQFLNSDWLAKTLELQKPGIGCFAKTEDTDPKESEEDDEETKGRHINLINKQVVIDPCSATALATAASCFSAALRLTFEKTPERLKLMSRLLDTLEKILTVFEGTLYEVQEFQTAVMVFLMKVNLKIVFDNWRPFMDVTIRRRVRKCSVRSVNIYKKLMMGHSHKKKKLLTFLTNETQWIWNMDKARRRFDQEGPISLTGTSPSVDDYDNHIEDSTCFSRLADIQPTDSEVTPLCELPGDCLNNLRMNYANSQSKKNLRNRLRILMFARYSRNCHLTTELVDNGMPDLICNEVFNNDEKYSNLPAFAVYCSMNVNSKFDWFHRDKVVEFLKKDPTEGCVDRRRQARKKPVLLRKDKPTLRKNSLGCDGTTTLLAATYLSTAIRFIAEMYFYDY